MSAVRIGISAGDLNGVGLEVALKALLNHNIPNECVAIIYASEPVVRQNLELIGHSTTTVRVIGDPMEGIAGTINILKSWDEEVTIEFGASSVEMGKLSYISLSKATDDLVDG